jgi:hypothetical protein
MVRTLFWFSLPLLFCLLDSSRAQSPEVVLFGEALCPFTIAAIIDVLGPLFDGGLAGRFSFRYVAYGNARFSSVSPSSSDCQCQANALGFFGTTHLCVTCSAVFL